MDYPQSLANQVLNRYVVLVTRNDRKGTQPFSLILALGLLVS